MQSFTVALEMYMPCLYFTCIVHLLGKNGKCIDKTMYFFECLMEVVFFNQHLMQSHLLSSWTPEQIILPGHVVGPLSD